MTCLACSCLKLEDFTFKESLNGCVEESAQSALFYLQVQAITLPVCFHLEITVYCRFVNKSEKQHNTALWSAQVIVHAIGLQELNLQYYSKYKNGVSIFFRVCTSAGSTNSFILYAFSLYKLVHDLRKSPSAKRIEMIGNELPREILLVSSCSFVLR